MGSADVVPGVSGGTIAFITGIYDKLLESINNINFSLISLVRKEGFASAWKKINGAFLLSLGLGISTAILTLSKVISFILLRYPILLWAFFFGLILASCLFIGKQIKKWNITQFLSIIIGIVLVVYVSTTPPLSPNQSLVFLFFCGALAICAMILPGISGSFIFLLLGAYSTVISAVGGLGEGLSLFLESKDSGALMNSLKIISVVGAGAILGLLTFARLLKFLLDKHPNTFISFLLGLLIGSLWKLWPWKIDPKIYLKGKGEIAIESISDGFQSLSALLRKMPIEQAENYKSFIEKNVLPHKYQLSNSGIDNQLLPAIGLAIFGFLLLLSIERITEISKK